MNWDVINSIANTIANILLFCGCLYFYYNHITKDMNKLLYYFMRVATAMLLSGSLARILLDINYAMVGKSTAFIWYEALMALSRNYGAGFILPYAVYKYVQMAKELFELRAEIELLNRKAR